MNRMKPFFALLVFALVFSMATMGQKKTPHSDALEQQFKNPPLAKKPYVWWHWMGSNFSKSGITKDLEAMKSMGIGGATIFNLTSAVQESHFPTLKNPWPNQTYRSPEYWEALRFAAAEADRLGLEIGLHNTVGYSTTGGPWIDETRSMQRLVWTDTLITGGSPVQLFLSNPTLIAEEGWGKTGRTLSFYKEVAVLAVPANKKDIHASEIINLSTQYNPEKGLSWNAPAGNWMVYRICHASTGRAPHPIPDDLLGKVLEVDKMSEEQNNFHWNNVLGPLKEHLGNYLGKSFKHVLIDSYEAGRQNWTPNFRQEFIKRKGYDPIPWLASFSVTVGTEKDSKDRRIVNSQEQTNRFEWDYKDVIAQLFFENGWKVGKQQLEAAKLSLQMEPYGGPFNTAQSMSLIDLPMAEFWTAGIGGISPQVPAAARAAGKTVVGAEAFTGRPEVSQFTEDPAFLKTTADRVFTQGINRLVLHHWVHQPFDDKYQPGMGMGWWGTHFGRNQTWFEPGKAFFTYLARCQALLQQGEQVADYLCVDQLKGHADLISTTDFIHQNITVDHGKLVLPSGRKYKFLVFSDSVLLPETVIKIKNLVAAGAIVVAPKPLKSPSLKDYPQCDETITQIANLVWTHPTRSVYNKGYVYTKMEEALKDIAINADVKIEKAVNSNAIKLTHRLSKKAAIFFISNQSDTAQEIDLSFNISGKQPELWQAEDGGISNATIWNSKNGRTLVTLKLKGMQSIFVVFRTPIPKKDHLIGITSSDSTATWSMPSGKANKLLLQTATKAVYNFDYASGKQKSMHVSASSSVALSGPWKVSFSPKNEAPFEMNFDALTDFSKHPSNRVKYFAGTANYQKIIDYKKGASNQRTILDLGEMNDIAEVRVNGKKPGVLWYPPYTIDLTDFLKSGANQLEILVTNNWANRLIGDEQEPADFEWGKDRGEKMGRALLAYPEWFLKNQPRPSSGRKTFSVWYYYRKESPLKHAGLVGPVRLVSAMQVDL